MTRLFALAIFISAGLLFMVQPLTGKVLLPALGGSPAVWSTCLVFFQASLLLGYLYAHALSHSVAPSWQRPVHIAVLIAASLTLPLRIDIGEPGAGNQVWWVLAVLFSAVGLPFIVLSATAPLLQQWFSRTDDPAARDPYFLYVASNAGSLLGLVGYLALEPVATRRVHALGWSFGFWVLAALITACAYASRQRTQPLRSRARVASRPSLSLRRRAEWIVLALVPSALLLGVTHHLAADVVSAPLLWVIPLSLYLATFMAAFSTRGFRSARRWGTVAPFAALSVLVLSLAEVRYPIALIAVVHLAAFTILAMLCHTRLAERRPEPAHLTWYFLCISIGGVLGGVAAAIVAPLAFSSVLEYPLATGAALLLRPQSSAADRDATSRAKRWTWRAAAAMLLVIGFLAVSAIDGRAGTPQVASTGLVAWLESSTGSVENAQRAVRAALAIPAALLLSVPRAALLFAATTAGLLGGAGVTRTGGDILHRERTFFGVHQVTSMQNGDWHVLTHGTTTHGVQAVRGRTRSLPTAYYHPSGPIGDVVFTLVPDGRLRDVAVIGLGAGALAAYAANGSRMDFFEVDTAVIGIAENPSFFTYLADARARPGTAVRAMPVDGRRGLRAMPHASYDLIVVDAFSSDSIPTHLITREAIAIYTSRLKPRGVIAFHVSSRFFDLRPALARIAADQSLVSYVRDDQAVPPERAAEAMRPSVWVTLARSENDLGQLARSAPRWTRLVPNGDDPLWTDDYSNVLGTLQK